MADFKRSRLDATQPPVTFKPRHVLLGPKLDLTKIPAYDELNLTGHLRGVGKTKKLGDVKAWLQDLPFLLRGPPGCGKKHLLLQAVGRQYSLFDLGMISNSEGTIQSMLQKVVDTHSLNKAVDEKQGPDGKPDPDTQQTLLALYGCEHLTVEGGKVLAHPQSSTHGERLAPTPGWSLLRSTGVATQAHGWRNGYISPRQISEHLCSEAEANHYAQRWRHAPCSDAVPS